MKMRRRCDDSERRDEDIAGRGAEAMHEEGAAGKDHSDADRQDMRNDQADILPSFSGQI